MADEAQQSHTSNLPKMRTFGRDVARLQRTEPKAANQEESKKGKKAVAAPMHIPEQVVDGPRKDTSEKSSILSDTGRAFDVGRATQNPHTSGGTIVTDKRKKRRSFFGTLAAAFEERMGDAKKSLSHMEVFQEKVAPRISTPIARQDVIQKAASTGIRAPEDDHRAVVEKLKSQKQTAPEATEKPFVVKEAPKEEAPSWTHVVEEAPKTEAKKEPVDIAAPEKSEPISPQSEPVPPPVVPAPIKAKIPEPKPLPEVAPRVEEKIEEPEPQQVVAAIPETKMPEPTSLQSEEKLIPPAFESVPAAPAPLPQVADLPKVTEQIQKPKAEVPKPPRQPGRLRAFFMRAAIVFVILIAIGGGVGAGYYLIRSFGTNTEAPLSVAPTVVRTDLQIPLPLSSSRTALLSSLADIVAQSGTGVTHIYPMHETTNTPATASEILAVLDPRAPGSFLRSVSEYLTLGAVATPDTRPFIVLRTSNFDVGFAGMIAWEPYMSSDLTPLFGAPIDRTYDPDARTGGNTREAYFVDGVVQNTPVRILYNQSGEEGIVYGFIDRNTLIITTTSQAFATVRARIQ